MPTNNEQEILSRVLARSATDAEFRKRLLTEPKGAIEEMLGADLGAMPREFNIRFIEKPEDVDSLVVLPELQVPEGELSEEELAAVAGGLEQAAEDDTCWWTCAYSQTNVTK